MDLISVVIPIYNVEKYLERCVSSVLSQTYPNLQIILVDDGSPDNCGKICDEYNDPRIEVIHQENKGLSGARNAGIDIAKGEWITFIDSDDFVHETFIEVLHSLCVQYNVEVSQCGVVRGTDSSFPAEDIKVEEKVWDFYKLYRSKNRDYKTVAWAKLYKRSLFNNIRYPEGMINEDEDTTFKVMYYAGKSVITNRHLYYYYMSESSILRSPKKHVNFDFVQIFKERERFLQENGGKDLIETTKKELCLRLMLNYVSAKRDHIPQEELRKLLSEFYDTERQINLNHFSKKEKYAIMAFKAMPSGFSFLENRLSIIQRNKYAREKK